MPHSTPPRAAARLARAARWRNFRLTLAIGASLAGDAFMRVVCRLEFALVCAALAAWVLFCGSAYASALNPAVTQDNIAQTICRPGWTATVRPSTTYTNRVKRALMAAAGLDWADRSKYELDHEQPLELGGAPRSWDNLVLQAWAGAEGARAKDVVETRMKRGVCAGRITLEAAQACMATNWKACPK